MDRDRQVPGWAVRSLLMGVWGDVDFKLGFLGFFECLGSEDWVLVEQLIFNGGTDSQQNFCF